MKSLGLSFFTDTHWTLIGLLIFFSLFVVILVLQLHFHKETHVQHMSNLPFEGDAHE